MTEDNAEHTFEDESDLLEPEENRSKERGSGVGVGTVLVCSVIASIVGMVGGAFLSQSAFKPANTIVPEVTQADMIAMTSALDGLKTRTDNLEDKQAKIISLQNSLKSSTSETAPTASDSLDIAEFGEELLPLFEDIEKRLADLENGVNSPADTQTMPLQSGNQANSDEIEVLTTSVSNIKSSLVSQSKKYVSKSDLQTLKRRVDKLEAEFTKPPVLIPPFPRQAVMNALTGKTEDSGSWLSGLLGDEVRVVDAETVMRLDRIEKFVEAGDINAIEKELVYLPSEAKPVIDGWLAQFEQSE